MPPDSRHVQGSVENLDLSLELVLLCILYLPTLGCHGGLERLLLLLQLQCPGSLLLLLRHNRALEHDSHAALSPRGELTYTANKS